MTSSCHFIIVCALSLLICMGIISTAWACGQMPFGQGRSVNFTVSGFTLPSAMAFSAAVAVTSQVPQISRSPDAATALVRNLVMQAVNDVLEERGCNEGLPGFLVSAILGQLTIQVNYTPINCVVAYLVGTAPGQAAPFTAGESNCFILDDVVTALCAMMTTSALSPAGSTTNLIMANWPTQMWQSIFNRALQVIRRGSFGTNFAAASVTVM